MREREKGKQKKEKREIGVGEEISTSDLAVEITDISVNISNF